MAYTRARQRTMRERDGAMGVFRKQAHDRDSEVIDLRDSVLQPRPVFEFGFPTRCPECRNRGYLDHIDLARKVQYEHCASCWAKWERSEDDVYSLH